MLLLLCHRAFGMSISQTAQGGVLIDGPIERGDYEKFLKFITSDLDNTLAYQNKVYLNSPGGDVVEAIRISNLLKTSYSATFVAENGNCYSSCFLIWAGGVIRSLGDEKIGIHRITLTQDEISVLTAEKTLLPIAKAVEEYLLSVGIPRGIVDRMNETSSSDIFIFDTKWLLREGYAYSIMFAPTFIDLAQKKCGPNVLIKSAKEKNSIGADDLKNWMLCVNEFKKKAQGADFMKILKVINPNSPLLDSKERKTVYVKPPNPNKDNLVISGKKWMSKDNGVDINWFDASKYCRNFGAGWRLPSVDELTSIYDTNHPTQCGALTCNTKEGFNLTTSFMWSNERIGDNEAWVVMQFMKSKLKGSLVDGEKRRALCIQ